MKLRTFLMAFALLAISLSFGSINWPSAKVTVSQHAMPKVPNASGKRCLTEDQVSDAINKLSGQVQVAQARNIFMTAARRSSDCRRHVIAALMNAMDKPNLDIKFNQTDGDLWHEGSILLGDMKAVEALDLLVKHLYMDDGSWSRTMIGTPALEGVIKMGQRAIPKLSAVLQHDTDSTKRQYAVFCLFFIRGRASSVLKKALHSETDECVRRFMRESIKGLDNKKAETIEDPEAWWSAFGCVDGPSWQRLSPGGVVRSLILMPALPAHDPTYFSITGL